MELWLLEMQHAGARGLLAEEEERLFRLRQEIEGEARQELDRARVELEAEGRTTQAGKLCATPFGVDVVGITEFIALTGALVGGITLHQAKYSKWGFLQTMSLLASKIFVCSWCATYSKV